MEVKAAGTPSGASVEVRQLFYNLPARRKFLRAEETEAAHIQHYLTVAALASPGVAFVFIKDGRTVWQLPAIPPGKTLETKIAALAERRRALMGGGVSLIPVDHSATLAGGDESGELNDAASSASDANLVRVWGLIGAPGVSRSNRDDQHLFVNQRPVANRGLNFALIEGYHTALMKAQYPVCCLFIEINPDEVDVNVHPSKREIKFRHERAVRGIVAQAVREALLEFHQALAPAPSPSAARHPGLEIVEPAPPPAVAPEFDFAPPPDPPPREAAPSVEVPPAPATARDPASGLERSVNPSPVAVSAVSSGIPSIPAAPAGSEAGVPAASFPAAPPVRLPPVPEPSPLLNVPLRLIGVVGKLYVLLESDRGLVLIDQHAAHERILFEQMLRRLEANQEAASQRLLLPETVELGVRDAQFLRENIKELNRLGVGLSEFGERTFLLDGLPPFVRTRDARQFVVGLVDELKAAGQGINVLRLGEHTVAKTVCRHAVKANDALTKEELDGLVRDLRHCQMPYTCPHGRPTIIEMSYRELEKKFGRVQ